MSYKINKYIDMYIDLIETGQIRVCDDQIALIKMIRRCFEKENIYVDEEQADKYFGLQKYFPYKLFPWQTFIFGLHLCTYWKESGMPRWHTLFVLGGRGMGKDGSISFESMCLASPYNPVSNYDVDICANNETQAKRPVLDLVDFFERHFKKMSKFYYWTKEMIRSTRNGGVIRGHTNNYKGKDGLRSGAVILNEVHAYENYDNINVFTTGLGKKAHPRISIWTTNGDVTEGPLDDYIKKSEEILYHGKDDNGFLPFICRLNHKEDVHDFENWQMANPSLNYLPHLFAEIEKEYYEWLENPAIHSGFMTKRMNIRESNLELQVTSWENLEATNKEIVKLSGFPCVCGIDFSKTTDWAAVNFHFMIGEKRYDINHAWICIRNPEISRIKAPWREWANRGLLTIVDDVEINPELLTKYIQSMRYQYNIKKVCIDSYRYTLMKKYLEEIGFDATDKKNIRLVRPSDIMKIYPIIDRCFANQYFHWGDNPVLRWATNNTKLVKVKQSALSLSGENETGNYIFGKIEAKSRKTDPFMALVASMVEENSLPANNKIPMNVNFTLHTY